MPLHRGAVPAMIAAVLLAATGCGDDTTTTSDPSPVPPDPPTVETTDDPPAASDASCDQAHPSRVEPTPAWAASLVTVCSSADGRSLTLKNVSAKVLRVWAASN